MGFRTVVLLINDQQHLWSNDPNLGSLISSAGSASLGRDKQEVGEYGRVLECTHADTQTLAVIDSYRMDTLAHGSWAGHEANKLRDLALVKQAAEKLGYKLVKT